MGDLLQRLRTALADRYRVEAEVGHGGMAVVFRAVDLRHHRPVALKVLHPALAHALGPERFLREIATVAQLSHPNILPLHDSGEADGLLYYVMPFLEGQSLRDRLQREGRLPSAEAIRIVTEVADALAHAHARGLIHRDIKPENILFQAGHAMVSDFGIARAVADVGEGRLTETGLVVGTPTYMSPEQALGGTALDGRSDIYSLGCVLFELLAGVPPFRGASPQAIIAGHSTAPVPRLAALNVPVPGSIQATIDRALAKEPSDRLATAADLIQALQDDRPPAPALPHTLRRTATWSAAALALALVAWWGTRQMVSRGDPRIAALAVLPLENLSGNPGEEYLVSGVHEALIDELARLPALRVISRTSAMAYQGSRKAVPEIARELGVDGVVAGSVARRGDSILLQVHLIRARPEERQLWAERYVRDVPHILAVYREVALAVANQLGSAPGAGDRNPLGPLRVVDPLAYEAFLNGKFHWYQSTAEGLETAFQYFTQALGKDSTLALAYAGISAVWIGRLQMGLVPPAEAIPRARAAARRALDLDSMLAWGYHNQALMAIQHEWNWPAAEAGFRRALGLNPAFADAHAFYSHLLNMLDRPREARAQIDSALSLDPLNPMFVALDAVDLLYERRWGDAVRQANVALSAAPGHPVALWALWQGLEALRQDSAAADAAARYLAAEGQGVAAAAVREAYPRTGYRAAMRAGETALTTAAPGGYFSSGDAAFLLLSAGDRSEALDWLERGYVARDPNLPYLGWPTFDPIRAEARFQALRAKLALPR